MMPFRRKFKVRNPDKPRTGEPRALYWAGLVLVLLFVLSVVLALSGQRNPISGPVLWVSSHTVSLFRGVADSVLSLGYIFRLKSIHEDNIELANENAELKKHIRDIEASSAEADRLARLLRIPERDKFDYISARITGRSLDLWFDSVYINCGRTTGVMKGDLVINADGLVGEIAHVDRSISRVQLILNPDFAIGAITSGSRQQGIVEGGVRGTLGFANSLKFGFVPVKNRISVGEKVFTSGLATGRPRGVFIGHVTKVVEEPNRLTQSIEITPGVDLGSLEEVVVILYHPSIEIKTE